MTENKTQPTKNSVAQFINSVEHKVRRQDAKTLLKIFKDITGEKPVMWGFKELDDLLGKLGKHKSSKACLYINKLADVDEQILRQLIQKDYEHRKQLKEV